MNIGGFFSYVFNMPCEKICADISEYRKLVKEYNKINAETKNMQNSLLAGNSFGCANYTETGDYNIWGESKKQIHYCDNFFHKDCVRSECPRVEEHNEYWKLMEKRKELMDAKAGFWNAKFQNVR